MLLKPSRDFSQGDLFMPEFEYPFIGDRTPYASALKRHADRETVNLMVPGHGASMTGISQTLVEFIGERALSVDIPPLIDGIDVGPLSALVRSTELAAEAWGARKTWFLANGASQANRMAAIAVGSRGAGEHVVMQRSAHSSMTDGLIIADLIPRFVFPSIDEARGIHHGVTPADISTALSEAARSNELVTAVYVISPSYFGAVADIESISSVTRAAGVPLIVDAAWGAHFGFHPGFPDSPTRQGADVVISSTHKLGGSLTQSAMLHLPPGPFADELEGYIDRAYTLTQSTSASALLLGSLDIARDALQNGSDSFSQTLTYLETFRDQLRTDGGFPVVSDFFSDFDDIYTHDPMRISIDISSTGLSGHEVRSLLASKYGVFLEISTVKAVVAFVGPGRMPNLDRLFHGLNDIYAENIATGLRIDTTIPDLPTPGHLQVRPRQAFFGSSEIVSADAAVGRVSADALAAYPPGIPNVLPGEVVSTGTLSFLQAVARSPIGYVRGALDADVSRFRVLK